MNNQFIFIGRICRNLILKDAGNSKVLDVTLAITRKFKNADGTYDTDFIKCKAFGKTAENISQILIRSRKNLIFVIIPRSGKHQSAERKTSFHGKENTNPHKESSNPLMESTSCIIELEA